MLRYFRQIDRKTTDEAALGTLETVLPVVMVVTVTYTWRTHGVWWAVALVAAYVVSGVWAWVAAIRRLQNRLVTERVAEALKDEPPRA